MSDKVGTTERDAGVVASPGGPDFYAALVAALGELSEVPKGQTASAGTYQYTFADLASVLTYVRPILAGHGLAVTQPVTALDGNVVVETVILHTSGESLAFGKLSMPRGQTPQQTGAAITYARRYSLLSTLGLATVDDDGAAASKYEPPKVEDTQPKKPGPGARAGAERIVALLQSEEKVTEDVAKEATRAAMKETGRAWADLIRPEYQDGPRGGPQLAVSRRGRSRTGPPAVTDHDPASLTTPGGYLQEAQVAARNIRAWVGRQSKPQYAGYMSNTVDWVIGVLDTLDLVLTRATQSVDHHMPQHRPRAVPRTVVEPPPVESRRHRPDRPRRLGAQTPLVNRQSRGSGVR